MLYYVPIFLLIFQNVYSYLLRELPFKFGSYTPYTRRYAEQPAQEGIPVITATEGINSTILENLKELDIFNFNELQNDSIPKILEDSNTNICILSQTGTGKTISYLVPIVQLLLENEENDSRAVILVPNGMLTYQVYEVLKKLTENLPIKVMTVDDIETGELPQIVVSTPSKFLNKFKIYNMNYKLNAFELVKFLVLDEADHLFIHKEVLREVLRLTKNRKKTILSSSTLSNYGTKSDANFLSRMFKNCLYVRSDDLHKIPPGVSLEFVHYNDENDRFEKLVSFLKDHNHRTLIYRNKSPSCHDLYSKLKNMGKNVHMLNKNVDIMEQLLILNNTEKKMIILSTDLSSRGVDFRNIKTVIHYDFPTNAINFIHRTGRVGRNGTKGNCLAFWTDSDEFLKTKLEENLDSLSNVFSRRRGLRKKFRKALKEQENTVT